MMSRYIIFFVVLLVGICSSGVYAVCLFPIANVLNPGVFASYVCTLPLSCVCVVGSSVQFASWYL